MEIQTQKSQMTKTTMNVSGWLTLVSLAVEQEDVLVCHSLGFLQHRA
jgi:hypothetical protein